MSSRIEQAAPPPSPEAAVMALQLPPKDKVVDGGWNSN